MGASYHQREQPRCSAVEGPPLQNLCSSPSSSVPVCLLLLLEGAASGGADVDGLAAAGVAYLPPFLLGLPWSSFHRPSRALHRLRRADKSAMPRIIYSYLPSLGLVLPEAAASPKPGWRTAAGRWYAA
eukprot:366328-Chlamydomonas_euryale.AAC.9